MAIRSKKAQLQELLHCQLEHINEVQNLLQVMEAQKELLFQLNKKVSKNKKSKQCAARR